MKAIRSRRLLATLLVAVFAPGCGQRSALPEQPEPAAPTSSSPSEAEIEALYRARIDSARMRFTEADVRFMSGMIHHHAQALQMVRMAAANGASPAVQRLAARIDNAQRDEIATMQRWLRDRGQAVVEVQPDGRVSGHGEPGERMRMPGMLTPAQMRELEAARGQAFDRLFLTYMIQHHRGAVTMVRELFATDGAGQDEAVFRFASDVQVDQDTEIERMQRMLDAMGNESA